MTTESSSKTRPSAPSRRAFLVGALGSAAVAGVAACSPTGVMNGVAPVSVTQSGGPLRVRTPLISDRQGFNRRWWAPALEAVYVPHDAAEVAAHVEDAVRSFGSDVKVVSGRHGYESFVYNESTRAIIDMSSVNSVGYDAERRAYFVDAGCENWTVYRTLLNGFGRTLPGGSCYSVGAGGHISGGGFGLLSRMHGLVVDHVTGIDVVTWDRSTKRASMRHVSNASSDRDERDLFWALRGAGGGSFGVIVRFYFADPPVAPAQASHGTFSWQWDDLDEAGLARLLDSYAALVAEMPNEEFTLLKLNHAAAGSINLIWQRASSPDEAVDTHVRRSEERLAEVAASLGVPSMSAPLQHFTFLEAVQTLNGSGSNHCGKYKSAYLNKPMPGDHVAAVHHWLHVLPQGLFAGDLKESLVQIDSFGGAINAVPADATAVPHRNSLLTLQYQTYWETGAAAGVPLTASQSARSAAHLSWIRGFYNDVYAATGGVPDPAKDASGTVAGCYVNYADADLGTHADGGGEQALRLYFGDNLRGGSRSLVAVKRRWDPDNVFQHAQSVPVD